MMSLEETKPRLNAQIIKILAPLTFTAHQWKQALVYWEFVRISLISGCTCVELAFKANVCRLKT
jgi:hypothetical protein